MVLVLVLVVVVVVVEVAVVVTVVVVVVVEVQYRRHKKLITESDKISPTLVSSTKLYKIVPYIKNIEFW